MPIAVSDERIPDIFFIIDSETRGLEILLNRNEDYSLLEPMSKIS